MAKGFKTKIIDKGAELILQNVRAVASGKPFIKIGIQGELALEQKKSDDPNDKSKLTNVEVATFHEFGGEGDRPPERSFIRSTMDDKDAEFREFEKKQVGKLLDGKQTVEGALGLIGLKIQRAMQEKIRSKIPPPLAQSTIDRKGSSTPLIDTGQLIQSLTYVVELNSKAGK
jgi:hypothetical protein